MTCMELYRMAELCLSYLFPWWPINSILVEFFCLYANKFKESHYNVCLVIKLKISNDCTLSKNSLSKGFMLLGDPQLAHAISALPLTKEKKRCGVWGFIHFNGILIVAWSPRVLSRHSRLSLTRKLLNR